MHVDFSGPGMPGQQQVVGSQGIARPQLPANFMQRTPVNRLRNQTPTVNQAECDAIAVAWYVGPAGWPRHRENREFGC